MVSASICGVLRLGWFCGEQRGLKPLKYLARRWH